MPRTAYRKRKHSDVWHFHRACRWWPPDFAGPGELLEQVERKKKPSSGEFCDECLSKERRGVPESGAEA